MQESLMQYVWQHRLWEGANLTANDGRTVRVLDPGLLNRDAGPDFFNAKVEIGGQLWVGNIEIHVRASDWQRHGHHTNKAYDSVVLHVVGHDDAPVFRTTGERIPQVELRVSPLLGERYGQLVNQNTDLPCGPQMGSVPALTLTMWMERLAVERLQDKAQRVQQLLELYHGSWEDVCYVTVARNLGFGKNGDAMERLARSMPLRVLGRHSDSLLQLEALLFGQAGMLADEGARLGDYYGQLRREWQFLQHKYGLKPLEPEAWKLFRTRPQNFPYRRIAVLAQLAQGGFGLMQQLLEAATVQQLHDLLQVKLTGYWASRYVFAPLGGPREMPAFGTATLNLLLINTVAPLLYAHGMVTGSDLECDRAADLLEQLPPERNSIVDALTFAGLECGSALQSQAMVQLRRAYCEPRKCIYCDIGHHLLAIAAKP